MKIITNLLTIFFLTLGSQIMMAQGYTFKVLANKGSNEVKSGGTWKPLKTGASLESSDELKLASNSYLGLVHASGKTLEIKSPGNHKVSDLASKVNKGGSSVASKYADFVLSKINAESKKNRLSATGAVHRGDNDNNIQVYMPSSNEVFSEKAIISWESVKGKPTYQITLKNMFDDILMVSETSEPKFTLNMDGDKLSNENVILMDVKVKGNSELKSGTYAIKRLGEGNKKRIEKDLKELMEDIKEESALNNYIVAGFYEENNLLIDARTNYEKAMNMAPGVESYEEAYSEFLLRNRLGL